jgi:hypothetical protein
MLRPGASIFGAGGPPAGLKPAAQATRVAPPSSAPGGVKKAAEDASKMRLTVTTQSMKGDVVTQTLVGNYTEQGSNHGRKVFKKTDKIPGHEAIEVFIYYWDARDGAEFSGWWFGDQIGGTQVWSKAPVHTPMPPKTGWRIPWDAEAAQPGALIVDQSSAATTSAVAAAVATTTGGLKPNQGFAASNKTPEQRLKEATDELASIEVSVNANVEEAKKTLAEPDVTNAALQQSVDNLQKGVAKIAELKASLTSSVTEARKQGIGASPTVTELSKLMPKITAVQNSATVELNKVRAILAKRTGDEKRAEAAAKIKASLEAKQAEAAAANKVQEEKDTTEFQALLPKLVEDTTAVDAAVDALSQVAAPLLAEPPEASPELDTELLAIQNDAEGAQKKLQETRGELNIKINDARKYAPETRKTALAELQKLQIKLADAQKKVNGFKTFKKDFAGRVAARKALAEFSTKFITIEAEVEQASNMCKVADAGQMSEEQITEFEKVAKSAREQLNVVNTLISTKSKGADSAMTSELDLIKKTGSDLKITLDEATKKVVAQRELLNAKQAFSDAQAKMDKVDEFFSACQAAEMPFLKGIEVLPKEESEKALTDSDAAAGKTQVALNQTKAFVKTRLAESQKLPEDVRQSVADQLGSITTRIEATEAKLTMFKKETAERKLNALLCDANIGVDTAEEKVSNLEDGTKIFEKVASEEASVEELKEAIEKITPGLAEASTAVNETRMVLAAKQKQARGGEAAEALAKLLKRLNEANEKLTKHKQAKAAAERYIKIKEILAQKNAELAEAETNIEKATGLAPGEGDDLTEEAFRALEDAMATASKMLKILPTASAAVQPLCAGSPVPATTKEALEKVAERKTAVSQKLDKLKASTKVKREAVLCEVLKKEGEAKIVTVESAIEKCDEVELPFLKGVEVIPLDEAKKAVADSETESAAAEESIKAARAYIAAKTLECKTLGADVAKEVTEAFAALTVRVNAAAQKISTFSKDTASRKKSAQVQEAGARVDECEEFSKKVVEAAAPFAGEDGEKMTEEEATAPLKTFLDAEKEAKTKISETRLLISSCTRNSKDIVEHMEQLKKFTARIAEIQAEMAKVRKAPGEHEGRFIAKRLLAESNEKISTLEGILKTATDACAPILEEGGEKFLVGASARTLAHALGEHAKAKNLDTDGLFAAAGGGGPLTESIFIAYLAGLPEATGREDTAFTDERRQAIFKSLCPNGSEKISKDDFRRIFSQKCVCKQGVSVTDGFVIAESKAVCKIEPGEILETCGVGKRDDAGLFRGQVKRMKDNKEGWVTLEGNQGTSYVENILPYTVYCKEVDQAITEAFGNVAKVGSFLAEKVKEGGLSTTGPVADAKKEINKLKTEVASTQKQLEDLKKKLVTGKSKYQLTLKTESNAHIVKRDQKEAEGITSVARSAADEAEAAFKELAEKANPFTDLDAEMLLVYKTPVDLIEEVQKLGSAVTEKVEAARKVIAEQLQVAAKVTPPTRGSTEAKKQLDQMKSKLATTAMDGGKTVNLVRSKEKIIVDKFYTDSSRKLREMTQTSGISEDQLFDQLAQGGERIAEATLCSKLESLDGLNIKPQHAKLICKRIEAGDVSRRRFLNYVQLYYAVVKSIALTDNKDVNECKTVRKAEHQEVMEVIEGPFPDEKTGLIRVRVRSMMDRMEGWVSVKGNQGTPFLQEVEKPFYTTRKEMSLDKELSGSDAVRTLIVDEVLEHIEGPRTLVYSDVRRAKFKASKDGAVGWVTMKDKNQVEYAEVNKTLYCIKQAVAMTDSANINDSKVLRKLQEGELFEMEGEPVEDAATPGIARIQGVAKKDGMKGWVTSKGNAGTAYVEPAAKCYTVTKAVELHKAFKSVDVKCEVVRTLEVGEALHMTEGPKDEKVPQDSRVKVRAFSDGSCGWISRKEGFVKSWTPNYKCLENIAMHGSRVADDSTEVLRELQKGETVELLEGPVSEGASMRIRCVAKKDRIVGWVTLTTLGKRFLDC